MVLSCVNNPSLKIPLRWMDILVFLVTQSKFDYRRISVLFVKTNRSLLRLL